jgi:hypothetical protein
MVYIRMNHRIGDNVMAEMSYDLVTLEDLIDNSVI